MTPVKLPYACKPVTCFIIRETANSITLRIADLPLILATHLHCAPSVPLYINFYLFITEHGFLQQWTQSAPCIHLLTPFLLPIFHLSVIINALINAAFSYNSVDYRPTEYCAFDASLIFISIDIFRIHLKSVDLIVKCVFYQLDT